ncbi:MAG TPA: pentapeptide repeat-containing protein [Pyrinomonadaceae bacterium]|nr:pentapeptide repeat-containing protein [Pyrinomonadaceae bacterium]
MSSSPLNRAPSTFVCACDKWARSACEGLPFFKKHQGRPYCVLHYPARDKVAAFDEVLQRKLDAGDFDFCGVWFPTNAKFGKFRFNAPADFTYATFSSSANFNYAVFAGMADFRSATFGAEAYFGSVTFYGGANFYSAMFKGGAFFISATFEAEADFFSAAFRATADFGSATFKDYVRFAGGETTKFFGDRSSLNLQFVRVEKPDRFSFHTLTLRPHWFVNVDARKFEFINLNWNYVGAPQEIEHIGEKDILSAHILLATASRNLAVNAEENHRYEEASGFRYMAMEAQRLERWHGFAFWTLGWWYWLASGYGERVLRAFMVLLAVWLLFAALYAQVGFVRWEPRVTSEQEAAEARRDEVGRPLRGWRALTYSLGVMTLQKPEPHPATDAAQAVVMLETILGPVQAALLALAIRRKFMR